MSNDRIDGRLGRVCWVDLATSDEGAANRFYCGLFGWALRERRSPQGQFSTFSDGGPPFASLYRLTRKQIEHGVPSHWTSYVSVRELDAAISTAVHLGGQVIVPPQDIAGFARVGLIADPAGALIGLWEAHEEAT
jgi:predicted enzyme related to lactoylglutathione lyase